MWLAWQVVHEGSKIVHLLHLSFIHVDHLCIYFSIPLNKIINHLCSGWFY